MSIFNQFGLTGFDTIDSLILVIFILFYIVLFRQKFIVLLDKVKNVKLINLYKKLKELFNFLLNLIKEIHNDISKIIIFVISIGILIFIIGSLLGFLKFGWNQL